jgi:superfamily II DNA or RNA helicase
VKSAFNSKQFKEKKWDGYIKLYKRWEHTFPTGLLGEVLAALTQKGFKYKVEYVYETSPDAQFNWTICDGLIPDPDQVEAVNIAKQGKRGVVKAPTGFGKVA